MLKKWFTAALAGLFLIALTGSAFAWTGRADIGGRPELFHPAGPVGYYIWQDESGLHIWSKTHDEGHIFSGVISTDGSFYHVRGHRLEIGDSYNVYHDIQNKFWFDFTNGKSKNHFSNGNRTVDIGNGQLHFKFPNAGGNDGLNFSVNGAHFVSFDLYMDGRPIDHRMIFISQTCWHPEDHTFKFFL